MIDCHFLGMFGQFSTSKTFTLLHTDLKERGKAKPGEKTTNNIAVRNLFMPTDSMNNNNNITPTTPGSIFV